MTPQVITTDVLVIGGGLAGERCAMEAAAAGQEAMILSLVPPRRSHSCAAQGGMQAALGNCVKAEGDSPQVHFLDTVRGSDWGADQEVANIFAEEAPAAVRELAHFGVPWTRVRGGTNISEAPPNGALVMRPQVPGTPLCTQLIARSCDWALRFAIALKPCRLFTMASVVLASLHVAFEPAHTLL